jgi:transposase
MTQANPPKTSDELCQLSPEKLVEIIVAQYKRIEELEQEIERLKTSLNLDSQTSSKPPSTDLLKKSEKVKEVPEKDQQKPKRKPGGQPGHPGKTRKGFARVDRIEVLKPLECPNCGSKQWSGKTVRIDRQQVAQLVTRPIEIVEYQSHHCQCAQCAGIVAAKWPAEIIPGQDLGVRLQGLLSWLGNYAHMTYEKQQELLWELGEIEISTGTLVATNERVFQAIVTSVENLKEWIVEAHPPLHSDETPWPVKGIKEWLWVLAGENFCLFHGADTRGRIELEVLLGSSYDGVLISDDFSVYNGYQVAGQQKCLAHLRRHFQRLFKTKGLHNQDIAQTFLDLIDEAFEQHRLWRQNQDEVNYRNWASGFLIQVNLKISQWLSCAGYEAGKLLRSLQDKAEQWWYFLEHPHVPPDNNLAERCLRTAVTKRKVCGGSRSLERFRHTANLLSVIQTCRLQGRSVITFFEQAKHAIVTDLSFGKPLPDRTPPSLIPQPST